MSVDSTRTGTRSHGISRLVLVLLLAPVAALAGWWATICVSLGALIFPPAWLILLSLVLPLCVACGVLLVSRAVVFGFFREFSQRARTVLGMDDGGNREVPFLLFHSGQELELLTETLAAWKQEVAASAERLSSVAGLWSLEPQARFPWAGRSRVYQLKSAELKKVRGYCQFRTVACLGVFVVPPAGESGGRKRFDWLADIAGSVAGIAEEHGGFVALIAGQVLVLAFSLGRDERTLAIRAARAARQLQETLGAEYPGSTIRLAGDIFPALEGMLQVSGGLRYYIDAPEIGALWLAACSPVSDGGLRFSSRLVSVIKTGGTVS